VSAPTVATNLLSNTKPELRLDWCSYQAAKYACEKWHYSGCVPKCKTVKVGVWENGAFIGCVLFGDGVNGGMFKPYGLNSTQGCEMVRVALTEHKTTVTRIVRVALIFLKKHCPGSLLVASFADPEQSHHGGIYQGGNWVYAGITEPHDEYLVCGKRMHGRALRQTRSNHKLANVPAKNIEDWARRVLDPNIKKFQGSSKHRYLYPLTPEMRAKIEPLRKPYPKRASNIGNHPDQGQGGGAVPT